MQVLSLVNIERSVINVGDSRWMGSSLSPVMFRLAPWVKLGLDLANWDLTIAEERHCK